MSKIVCFGEILWDVFPSHKKIGGAPLNVAIRLKSFDNDVYIISSVGDDADGKQLLSFINDKQVNASEVQVSSNYKTSNVIVKLDKEGSATYIIEKPCAWDFINLTESSIELVKSSDALIYGSLVTRMTTSKATLLELLKVSKFKVFDVNLRTPYYDYIVLKQLMLQSDLIKFNDEEILEFCNYYDFKSDNIKSQIRFVSEETNTSQICVTQGGEGAIFYTKGKFYKSSGYKVIVKDTVGAGDSFLATLINGILKHEPPQISINKACAIGALVASKEGANPIIESNEIQSILEYKI